MRKRILAVVFILSGSAFGIYEFQGRSGLKPADIAPAAPASNLAVPRAAPAPEKSPPPAKTLSRAGAENVLSAHDLVRHLSASLESPLRDFAAREQLARAVLARSNAQELEELSRTVATDRTRSDEARVILYVLSLAGEKAIPALRQIALAPDPAAGDDLARRFAFSLRLDALEILEGLTHRSKEARTALSEVSRRIENRGLRELARIAHLGVQQGSPGKLHRLIERTLRQHGG